MINTYNHLRTLTNTYKHLRTLMKHLRNTYETDTQQQKHMAHLRTPLNIALMNIIWFVAVLAQTVRCACWGISTGIAAANQNGIEAEIKPHSFFGTKRLQVASRELLVWTFRRPWGRCPLQLGSRPAFRRLRPLQLLSEASGIQRRQAATHNQRPALQQSRKLQSSCDGNHREKCGGKS